VPEAGAKFLLDENISPAVAWALWKDGFDACCVRDRGLRGAKDVEVLDLAYVEDRIVVTKDGCDFRRLCRGRELHPGIIILQGDLLREEQIAIVRLAARRTGEFDMVNKMMLAWGNPWPVLPLCAEPDSFDPLER
jgi:predicted nuclease of predicted toxin-antitoxin system